MRLGRPLLARYGGRTDAATAYARASLPRRRRPWRETSWCALDFELTGLDLEAGEIIAFGAIPIEAGRAQLAESVSGLVRPEREPHEAAIRVHGLRNVDLRRAPPLEIAIEPLVRAITGRVLVAHTAAVERSFLSRALRAQSVRLRGPIIDTEVLGRLWLYKRDGRLLQRLPLGELAHALGLPADRPHDALGDALTTAQVFIALAHHLDAEHPQTVGSLARARRWLDAARRFDHTTSR
jgi:DNA polymerase III subunit epsilon